MRSAFISFNPTWAGLLLLVLLSVGLESCRVKRCPLDNCHIRMRHRHPSMMRGGSDGVVYDPNAGDEAALGPVYRGAPWWQVYRKDNKMRQGTKTHQRVSMRDPKIGQGYKPGYKYKHKDNSPAWSERVKKYKKKKIEDDEKAERKAARDAEKAERKGSKRGKEGKDGDVEDPATEPADTTPDEMKLFGGEQPAKDAPKESRKERRAKAKREKSSKKKEKEEAPKEEAEEEGF